VPPEAGWRKAGDWVRGVHLPLGTGFALRDKPGLFSALDLRDPAVMHNELHDAVAQVLDFGAHQREPFGLAGGRGWAEGGFVRHGGSGIDEGLDGVLAENVVQDALGGEVRRFGGLASAGELLPGQPAGNPRRPGACAFGGERVRDAVPAHLASVISTTSAREYLSSMPAMAFRTSTMTSSAAVGLIGARARS